jgi:hypothetical protein
MIIRPRGNDAGLRVPAVIKVNTDERIICTQHKPDAVVLSTYLDGILE